VQLKQPEVEEVRNLQSRWQALEVATNADAYPAELFHRIVALLPEQGIRLKEFRLELSKISLVGKPPPPGMRRSSSPISRGMRA